MEIVRLGVWRFVVIGRAEKGRGQWRAVPCSDWSRREREGSGVGVVFCCDWSRSNVGRGGRNGRRRWLGC